MAKKPTKKIDDTPDVKPTVKAPAAPPVVARAAASVAASIPAPMSAPVALPKPVVAAAAPAASQGSPVMARPTQAQPAVALPSAAPKVTLEEKPTAQVQAHHGPVAVLLPKAGTGSFKAVIRYHGPLATKTEKLVAVLGMEWFGSPRWQLRKDVEMKKVRDGAFEAEVELVGKDDRGAALMALQLAFTTPSRQNWDSAGAPYGYYQVSALNGHVESVLQ